MKLTPSERKPVNDISLTKAVKTGDAITAGMESISLQMLVPNKSQEKTI